MQILEGLTEPKLAVNQLMAHKLSVTVPALHTSSDA